MAQKLTKVAETTTLANTDTLIVVDESAQNTDGSTGALKRIPKSSTGFAFPSDITSAISTKADAIVKSASGEIASFSDGGDDLPMKSLKVNIVPKQSGSGDPSPSNVRPISGWDAVETTRCGKNILQLPSWAVVNSLETVGSYKRLTLKVKPNADYYLNSKAINGYTPSGRYRYVLVTNNPTGDYPYVAIEHHSEGISNGAITSTADGHLWLLISPRFTETQWSELKNGIETQLELGSTATDYEPYEGETITTNLPQTVYGGVLDVVSGKLVIDRFFINDFSGLTKALTTISGGSKQLYIYNLPNPIKNINANVKSDKLTCNIFKTLTADQLYGGNQGIASAFGRLYFYSSILQTIEEWDAYLSNVQVVYELATPIEIQLTPTEVKTLLGSNNIWSESGTVEVEYRADSTLAYNELLSLIASLS